MTTPDFPPPGPAPAPPTYPFPPGTPETVPEDFDAEAMKRELAELRAKQSGQLTAEEVAEFRQLRADKKAADEKAAADAAAAAALLQPDTHHVHLSDGSVVDGSTIETHYTDAAGMVYTVAGAYPMPVREVV
jgi:hypothetical protein